MGIQDRDYIRSDSPSGGGSVRRSGMTIIHWLLIINIGVFALDFVLPKMQVGLGQVWAQGADRSLPFTVDRSSPQMVERGVSGFRIIQQDPQTGQPQVVGYEQFTVMPLLTGIGHFSTLKAFSHLEIWRFITYQFLHANVTHIGLNMFGLWIFGPVVLKALGSGRIFLAFYLTCGIFGAFLYLILNLLGWQLGELPGLLITQPWVPLVGASAAIFGVLMASAKVAGDEIVDVFFVLPMKLKVAAYVFFAIAAGNLLIFRGSNIGGDAAHIGGAIAGFYFIRKPHLLLDFFDDFLGSPRSDASPTRRKRKQSRTDRLLEKVSRDGMSSLSKREQRALAKASQRARSEGSR